MGPILSAPCTLRRILAVQKWVRASLRSISKMSVTYPSDNTYTYLRVGRVTRLFRTIDIVDLYTCRASIWRKIPSLHSR